MMKRFTQQAARTITACLLLEDAAYLWNEEQNARGIVMAARYLRRHVLPPHRGIASEEDTLSLGWFDAITDWQPAIPVEVAQPLLDAMVAEYVTAATS